MKRRPTCFHLSGGRGRNTLGTLRLLLMILGAGLGCVSSGVAEPQPAGADPAKVAELIGQLGDPSYEVRTKATRALCTLGPAASAALTVAAQGDDAEIVLRARRILQAFDALLFAGTTVTLEASPSAIEWDQPIDLRLTFTNVSDFPSRLPFDQSAIISDVGDAAQVANMVDLSEWLEVTGPKHEPIELRVDDISEDPAIMRVIESRLGDGPTMMLAPGQSVTVTGRMFNRGWARFPLLDEGAYSIRFEYIPAWQDAVLAAAKVGKVESAPIVIKVLHGAPATISREGAEADVVLEQAGDQIEARLINRGDRLIRVNANFGPTAPFAEGQWILEAGTLRTELALQHGTTWQDFRADRIQEVEPGQSIMLASAKQGELMRQARELRPGMTELNDFSVQFAYSNLADRQWQVRQGPEFMEDLKVPDILRNPLPPRILTTRQTSNRIQLQR